MALLYWDGLYIANAMGIADFGRVERFETLRGRTDNAVGGGKPDLAGGIIPQPGDLDHLAGLAVFEAPQPLAWLKRGLMRGGLGLTGGGSSVLRFAA